MAFFSLIRKLWLIFAVQKVNIFIQNDLKVGTNYKWDDYVGNFTSRTVHKNMKLDEIIVNFCRSLTLTDPTIGN